MKKLNDLLSMEILNDVEIIAGRNGLDRPVESVETLDTPDMTKFVANNSLLLTAGFSFKDNPNGLYNLVNELNAINCAGIGIKVKRFIHEIPQDVIDLADSLDFPIINIPNSITLTDAGHHLLRSLWENKLDDLFSAYKVQKKFTNMMLKGASLQSLIDHLGYLIGSPALLFSPFGHSIARSGDFRSERMIAVIQKVSALIQNNIVKSSHEDMVTSQEIEFNDERILLTAFSVLTSHPYPYTLVILNLDSSEIPYTTIEQASNVISSTLVKNEAIRENERVVKNNFFSSLVDGNIQSHQEVIHRGKHYGLKDDQKYVCIVCKVDEVKQTNIFEREERVNRLSHFIHELLVNSFSNQHIEHVIFMKNEYFVIILQFPIKFNEKLKQSILEIIKTFQVRMGKDFDTSTSFGISNFVNEMTEIPVTYREAVDALVTGTALNQKQIIEFYKTKELNELLRMIPEDNLRDFYEETLLSLAYPKTNEDKDLVNTLSVYLDHNCEITETSKILFVHRNTVKYRIAKCEKILQYNIHDPDRSLRLRTALLVRNHFTESL